MPRWGSVENWTGWLDARSGADTVIPKVYTIEWNASLMGGCAVENIGRYEDQSGRESHLMVPTVYATRRDPAPREMVHAGKHQSGVIVGWGKCSVPKACIKP